MLDQELIKKIADKIQTSELNARREYVQHLFLAKFYQQPLTNNIFFKGGTALRLVYGSPRFSEDLDFSTSSVNFKTLESIIETTLLEVEREGISTEIIESKKTSGGYLGEIEFNLGKLKVGLRLEVSGRDKLAKGEMITVVNNFIPAYLLMVLIQPQLVGQKIKALLERQKPRDFYDLLYILRANLLPVGEKTVLKKAAKLLKTSEVNFNQELKLFLPKSHWQIIRDFKASLEREISRH